ncbi:hypothetical protein EP56_01745 [Listeriaceae bacterium FSL A5-0209]|nr:hypothetical protein EP56_01745 [Listeriaceae bacterium FSL A5-0209]
MFLLAGTGAPMRQAWTSWWLGAYPVASVMLLLLFLLFSGYWVYKFRTSFRALEDLQNENSNQPETTKRLLDTYSIMWMDPNIPYYGEGGLHMAHIRPSVLSEYGIHPPIQLEDAYMLATNGEEESQRTLDRVMKALVNQGETTKEIAGEISLLEKELPESYKQYAVLVAKDNTNVIVYGITRSGKGVFFVNPTIDAFSRTLKTAHKASFFIADTKGIALRENYQMLKDRGYKILIFNTADPFFSNPFSPLFTATYHYEDYLLNEKLTQIERYRHLDFAVADIASLASILYIRPQSGNPFFANNARSLFRAVCLASIDYGLRQQMKEKICLYTIAKTIAKLMHKTMNRPDHPYLAQYVTEERTLDDLYIEYQNKSALDVFFGELDEHHPAKDAYGSIQMAAGASDTISGIAAEVLVALDPYVRSGNARLTAQNAFDFRELGFGDEPLAIFLVFPDSDSSNEELAALFIETSFRELVREADHQQSGECKRKVIYLLDEFGNLMKIPNIGKKMSAALSRNIRFHIVLQNIGQLDIYESADRKAIYANSSITMYIKSNDEDTNKSIQARLGKHTIASFTRQGVRESIKKTEVETAKEVDMMSLPELEQLQFGENIILRLSTTETLDHSALTQYPIFNRGSERMVPSFWYLEHEKVSWDDIEVDNTHASMTLDGYSFELVPPTLYQESQKAAAKQTEEQLKEVLFTKLQAMYEADGRYQMTCLEAWEASGEWALLKKVILFSPALEKNSANQKQGLTLLETGHVMNFIGWVLCDHPDVSRAVGEALGIAIGEEEQHETTENSSAISETA